jgi:hypothetical protein
MRSTLNQSLAVLLAAGLAACGGSSSGTPGGNPGTANLSLKGAITAQTSTSITVSGVTVSTSTATTRVEHAVADDSALKPGMVVKVKAHRGAAGSHQAEGLEIEFEDDVKGKVTGKTSVSGTSNGTITVAGQTVRIDDSTHFDDNTARLGSITAGVDRVRVSGVADDRGGLRATRVERTSDSTHEFEVKGVVSDLTGSGFTLTAVGGTTYTVTLASGASIPAGVVNGGYVEVRSNLPLQAGNAIVAASISVEDRLPGLPDVENELEGIVTSGTSASFVINGTTVITDPGTRWDGGVPDDLVVGVKVEAEGVLASDGTLSADKVKFKDYIKLQGKPVVAPGSVDASGFGTFSVNGISVRTDDLTRQDDAVTSLGATDFAELRGMLARDGLSVVVTRFRLRKDDRPIIQGLVTAKTASTVTILGKTVDLTSAQLRNFRVSSSQDGDVFANRADFFAAIVVGQTVVKARGSAPGAFVDPTLTAEEAELEGEK